MTSIPEEKKTQKERENTNVSDVLTESLILCIIHCGCV
jgi:hypothetical protein